MSTISIIGTGGMATAIGGRIAKAGHTIEVVGRDPAKARALADKLAAGATTGTYGAAPTGDIVILAVPYTSAAAVVAEYGDALDGKVIIDITNPISPDATSLVTPHGSSGAQEIAKAAPTGARVVKAFNTVFRNVLENGRPDVFIAGDGARAKASVTAFVESIGLRPLDVGGLTMAHWLEGMGLVTVGLAGNGVGHWDFALGVEEFTG